MLIGVNTDLFKAVAGQIASLTQPGEIGNVAVNIPPSVVVPALAAAITLLALAILSREILRGETQPYPAAWLVRLSPIVVMVAAQVIRHGNPVTIAMLLAQLAGGSTMLVVLLRKARGFGGFDRLDAVLAAMAAMAIGVWMVSDVQYAVFFALLVDVTATFMGVRAAWQKGKADSVLFWSLSLGSATLALATTNFGQGYAVWLSPLASTANALINISVILAVQMHTAKTRRVSLLAVVATIHARNLTAPYRVGQQATAGATATQAAQQALAA